MYHQPLALNNNMSTRRNAWTWKVGGMALLLANERRQALCVKNMYAQNSTVIKKIKKIHSKHEKNYL